MLVVLKCIVGERELRLMIYHRGEYIYARKLARVTLSICGV